MAITEVAIRAKITFEGGAEIATPYILSFNVNKARGSKSTFSARIKVKTALIDTMTGKVFIDAGTKTSRATTQYIRIFTGYVKTIVPSPCWEDPTYFIITLSGVDELYKLESRKFTRRQMKSNNSWAVITGIVSEGLRDGKLKYTGVDPILVTTRKEGLTSEDLSNAGLVKRPDTDDKTSTNIAKNVENTYDHIAFNVTVGAEYVG